MNLVLVPGAWHGAWSWESLIPRLAKAGHKAVAVDLAGLGDDQTPLAEVSMAAWVDQVRAAVATFDEPPILVGHSRGGVVVNEVAEADPTAIAGLIYISAALVPSGTTVLDFLLAYTSGLDRRTLAPFPIENGLGLKLHADDFRDLMYQESSTEAQEWALSRARPEPVLAGTLPAQLTPGRFGTVRRAYIECVKDLCFDIDFQRKMWAEFSCDPVITINRADHSPFTSALDELVDAIESIMTIWKPAPSRST